MKKKLINLLLTLCMAFAVIGFVGCKDKEKPATPQSLAVVGDSSVCVNDFSLDAYKLTVTMSDGTTQEITLSSSYLSESDLTLLKTIGEHTVTITYQGITVRHTFTLSTNDFKGITFADKTVTYDGNAHSLELVGVPSFATVNYDKELSYTNAGTYTVKATVTADNYNALELSATLTINKATYDMSGVTYAGTTATYDGTAHTITVDNLPDGVAATVDKAVHIDAGSYQVGVSFVGDAENYNTIGSLTKTLTIAKRELTVEFSGETSIKYDGNSHKTISVEGTNVLQGDSVAISLSYGGDMIEKGIYTVTATIHHKNYQLTKNNTVNVEITRETHTVTFCQEGEQDVVFYVPDLATVTETIPAPKQLTGYTTVWEEYDISCVTGNKVISAIRTIDVYDITYVLNGATNSSQNVSKFTVKDLPLSLENALNPENTYFYGWYLEEEFSNRCDVINSLEDITLYAKIVEGSDNLEYKISADATYYTVINYTGTDAAVYIPKTFNEKPVQAIGEKAFYEKRGIVQSVSLPDSITTIESFAFANCSKMDMIFIPFNVRYIEANAFNGCGKLFIYVETGNYYTWESNWNNMERPVVYRVKEVMMDSQGLIYAVDADTEKARVCQIVKNTADILIPENINGYAVNGILEDCFQGKTTIKSISILDGVTSIDSYAFYNCSSLTSIVIPDSVTTIGSHAFFGCSSLTSIVIPDSVTTINWYAFYNCSSLTSIVLPDNVTSIGDEAFSGCSSLTSIVLPDNITTIGSHAFSNCSSLTSIVLPDSVTTIGSYAFYNCSSLTSIVLPEGVTSIGREAFDSCRSLTSIVLPEGVTSIGSSAFYGCVSLTSVYYAGTDVQWAAINVESGNGWLTKASIYYNFGNEDIE